MKKNHEKLRIIVFLMTILITSCDVKIPDSKVYEINDSDTDSTHIYIKEPKLKKHILFCIKHNTNEVVYVHWQIDQTPEYRYFVEPYKDYLEKTWIEQHYKRRAK